MELSKVFVYFTSSNNNKTEKSMENHSLSFAIKFGERVIPTLRNCAIRKETEKAFLISGVFTHLAPRAKEFPHGVSFWVPKSQVIEFEDAYMKLPLWLINNIS